MKNALLFLLFGFAAMSVARGQTTIQEAYFHELKGMEDSAGVTHLFYRQYVKKDYQCSEEYGGMTINPRSDDVRHFNTDTQEDSVKFNDYFEPWCIDYYRGNNVIAYSIFEKNPEKWMVQEGFDCYHGIRDHDGNFFSLLYGCLIKQTAKRSRLRNSETNLILSPDQDSIYIDFSTDLTIPLSAFPDNWPQISENDHEEFERFLDSTGVRWNLLGIHPKTDSVYFATNAVGHLYRSTNYTGNFEFADSSGSHTKLVFDADSTIIYSLITSSENSESIQKIIKSDNAGTTNTWAELLIPKVNSQFDFLISDSGKPGHLFLADSTHIWSSLDFGDTFSKIFSSKDQISGLYKKPDSDILYVLTKEELLEVNIETKAATSLKQLPVSSEQLPNIPNQITLQQNYPNPFNPSTVISYQLTGNSLVRLEVFDVTGRKVAILVDGERQAAGNQQVTFDASGLSSGVYFYRLRTGGQTLTRKMLLVK